MIKNGTYKDDHYIYKIDNKVFKYYDEIDKIIIERKSDNLVEIWKKNYKRNYLTYYFGSFTQNNESRIICPDNKCSSEDKELNDKFYNYLDKYILGKSN